jgi:high affinity sulfate transporter 1
MPLNTPETVADLIRTVRTASVRRWLPGVAMLRRYDRQLLLRDLAAGVALAALMAPVGIGYAEAAGLPVICGLYATIVPLLVYALLGPSRILVLGPDSALAALVGATIVPLAAGNPGRAALLAALLAIISGVLCVLAGIARFGFITDLLSKPIRYGYMNGVALTLIMGQLPKILGFPVEEGSFLGLSAELFRGVAENRANPATCLIGLSCLGIMFGAKRWSPRFPGVLASLVAASLAVSLLDLAPLARVAVVGALPQGLPAFTLPVATPTEWISLGAGALAITLVTIGEMSVLSRIYALRGGYYVDDNQELVAVGFANLACGFFQGFPVSCSASRTPVAESAGAKTQMTGVVGALLIALLLLFAPGLMRHLPTAALGAVVVFACSSMVDVSPVLRLYGLRRGEFFLSLVCFLGVVFLGVIQGIFSAVGMALLAFIWRAWRPYCAVLGRIDGIKGYHDITRHPEARLIPGLVLFRWDAPLFFANAEIFREQTLRAISSAPTPTRWIVVAAEPVTDIDITAADMLAELEDELKSSGIELSFAEMKGPVKDRLKRYGLFTRLGTENFFLTIGQAVDHYVDTYRVDWIDWEDIDLPVV